MATSIMGPTTNCTKLAQKSLNYNSNVLGGAYGFAYLGHEFLSYGFREFLEKIYKSRYINI
jgi:hypothetical protein